ncbi:MAG: hypothetical protein IT381_20965 [Deltaproteobacteria bacterium]|nr:hypothetical protein [Deltaproteobacteria bacterium]
MNKMSQDKMFLIILVSVFAAAGTFLGALTMSGIAGKHEKPGATAHAGETPPPSAGEHH